MTLSIAVVGGGIAGVAAAWASAKGGAAVTLFHAQAGASELGSGAADESPWTELVRGAEAGSWLTSARGGAPEPQLAAFLDTLGCFRPGPALLATNGGVVRPAAFFDPALLDLAPYAGKRVAVADVERDDWDGPSFARMLSGSAWAVATGTTFEAVPVDLLLRGHERRIAPSDFAALHDGPERRDRLVRKVKEAVTGHDALLLGGWLGLEPSTVRVVREACPFGVGEATSPPGGAAGLRFALARGRLLHQSRVNETEAAVTKLARAETGKWTIARRGEHDGAASFDGVVLAVGGLVGGGIRLSDPSHAASGFRLSLDAPLALGYGGEPREFASATYGFDPTTQGGAWLERIGVVESARDPSPPGLVVAGDVVADSVRTVLTAARSGLGAAARLLAT